jgi:hypothetical protein
VKQRVEHVFWFPSSFGVCQFSLVKLGGRGSCLSHHKIAPDLPPPFLHCSCLDQNRDYGLLSVLRFGPGHLFDNWPKIFTGMLYHFRSQKIHFYVSLAAKKIFFMLNNACLNLPSQRVPPRKSIHPLSYVVEKFRV